MRELAERLVWGGLGYALFAILFSLHLEPGSRATAFTLTAMLTVSGALRTVVARRVIFGSDVVRDGRRLVGVAVTQSIVFAIFVAYTMLRVQGHLIPECLMLVGVGGFSSVGASLFAPFLWLDYLAVGSQLLPVYLWCVFALPRYGWLLGAVIVIHALTMAQLMRMNNSHIRAVLLAQLTLEAQSDDLRQARDAAEQAGSAKMRFLANMSHEIRTPLNGIIGLTEVLNSLDLNADQRELLDDIGRSGGHLLAIVNDVLDMAKVTSGKLTIEHTRFDIRQLIRDIAAPAAALAETQHLRFRVDTVANLPRWVEGDPVRARQVVSNLLSNAVKFTPAGSVVMAVQTPGPGWVRFEISDTGIGLSPEQKETIFEEFHQVDSSNTRKFGGTGLGLAISRRLAELMGGRLWVESSAGRGSTFFFEMPLNEAEAPEPEVAPEACPLSAVPPGLRVLVVEDNLINQKVIGRMLTQSGALVEFAGNGRIALDLHEAAPYDLVLMDCQMPELDGYEATTLIRALPGVSHLVPIIGVTANAFAEDRDRCMGAGMDAYISKPVSRDALLAAICRLAHPFAEGDDRTDGGVGRALRLLSNPKAPGADVPRIA